MTDELGPISLRVMNDLRDDVEVRRDPAVGGHDEAGADAGLRAGREAGDAYLDDPRGRRSARRSGRRGGFSLRRSAILFGSLFVLLCRSEASVEKGHSAAEVGIAERRRSPV